LTLSAVLLFFSAHSLVPVPWISHFPPKIFCSHLCGRPWIPQC